MEECNLNELRFLYLDGETDLRSTNNIDLPKL